MGIEISTNKFGNNNGTVMVTRRALPLAFTKSLKGRFFIIALVMIGLTISTGVVAILALRASTEDNHRLAQDHLQVMNDSQQLLQHAMEIELLINQLIKADPVDIEGSYQKVINLLDDIDDLVSRLGHTTSGPAIVDIHQVVQVFRNLVHIIARLQQEKHSPDESGQQLIKSQQTLERFIRQLDQQYETLMITANELSSRVYFDYRQAVENMNQDMQHRERTVLYIMLVTLAIILLVGWYFFRNIIARLREISVLVRRGATENLTLSSLLAGDDEIGEMAREIDSLLQEHDRLKQSRETLKEGEDVAQ
jgi:two-component system, NtrC family, sensor kinase